MSRVLWEVKSKVNDPYRLYWTIHVTESRRPCIKTLIMNGLKCEVERPKGSNLLPPWHMAAFNRPKPSIFPGRSTFLPFDPALWTWVILTVCDGFNSKYLFRIIATICSFGQFIWFQFSIMNFRRDIERSRRIRFRLDRFISISRLTSRRICGWK